MNLNKIRKKLEKEGGIVFKADIKDARLKDFKEEGNPPYVQFKYDGWFSVSLIKNGVAEIWGRTKKMNEIEVDMPDGVYLGEYIINTQWALDWASLYGKIMLFDVLMEGSYGERIRYLKKIAKPPYMVVEGWKYRGTDVKHAFNKAVELGYEGVVVRYSDEEIYRVKKVITKDYIILGFEISDSKSYNGLVRSIIGGVYRGNELVSVCRVSGLTDEERRYLTENQKKLKGQVFEAEGSGVFNSGALRHPRFKKLRPDKLAKECREEV